MLEVQRRLEQEAYDTSMMKAREITQKSLEAGRGSETNEGIILIKNMMTPVADKIREYLTSKSLRGLSYATREPIMDYLDNEETLAYMVLSEILNNVLNTWGGKYPLYHTPIITVSRSILSRIKQEYRLELFKQTAPKLDAYVDSKYKKLSARRRAIKKQTLARYKMTLNESDNIKGLTLGTNLIDAVIKANVGLITIKVVKIKKNKRSFVVLTKKAQDLVEKMQDLSGFFNYNYPIFVAKPKPWEGFSGTGGYYENYVNIDLVKLYNDRTNKTLVKGYFDNHPDFTNRYTKIVNSIQDTPWVINKRILKVLNTIYRERIQDFSAEYTLLGGLADDELPEIRDVIPYPEDPTDKEAYKEYCDKKYALQERFETIKSKSLIVKLAMSTARKYKRYKQIYFSYQVDFRGRLYPIQSHLHPQGTSVTKSLLKFAEGKPLDTEKAVEWFKIHGANTFGYDKELYCDRIRLMNEMHSDILLSARDPFNHKKWLEADEPFQFLAWCFEYADWANNPNTFKSHLPIPLDATCSGIQIYSGLMRDAKGCKAVNVINDNNNTKISDIYGEVATCVNRYLENEEYPKIYRYDTKDGVSHTVDNSELGASMIGKINRKITKRNTMTFPYNVSTFGMKDQVLEDILVPYEGTPKQFWDSKFEKWQVATFLSKLNYKGIGEVVEGAVECRDFLKSLTKEVVKKGNYIFYKTPLIGFPVIHRTVKYETKRVTTSLAKLSIRTPTTQLDSTRMVNGIAPNYIHSLDATLLFRTVELLKNQGVNNFALIHDSYGTHAADTEKLFKTVKEAYIEIFSGEPLYDFVEQTAPFRALEAKKLMKNDMNIDEVRNSDYIFS